MIKSFRIVNIKHIKAYLSVFLQPATLIPNIIFTLKLQYFKAFSIMMLGNDFIFFSEQQYFHFGTTQAIFIPKLEPYPLNPQSYLCEYKINSFPPQPRKPAWLMDGIKWMQIKMFHKIDDQIELNGKIGREKSK